MRIRQARQDDLPRMAEIEQLCFPAETAFPPGMFKFFIRYACTIVACEYGVVGFIVGYASGRTGIIYTLDVHPGHRRRGIGERLLDSIEQELYKSGARRCRLEAALENPAAIELYHKAGYREAELMESYYGHGKDAVRMVKELGRKGMTYP